MSLQLPLLPQWELQPCSFTAAYSAWFYEKHLLPSTGHPHKIIFHACSQTKLYALHCLFVFKLVLSLGFFPASTAHFYKWDCLKVDGSCTECWTNKPGNCLLCPRAKLWEQGNTVLCWEEYEKTDINLANLNAPGAIPQTFTFAGTYKNSSKQ